jgi:hypothetical protein
MGREDGFKKKLQEVKSQDSRKRRMEEGVENGLSFQLFSFFLKIFVRMFYVLNNIIIAPTSYLLY